MHDCSIPLSSPMIYAKAEEFAEKFKINEFKASMDLFEGFKHGNGITCQTICHESASVDLEEAHLWFNKRSNLITNYDEKYIFNVDKTGLFQ